MVYHREGFADGEIYHIILRALDNNLIFKDENDYYRGIFSIYEFNNSIPVEIWLRRKQRKKEKLGDTISQRDLLVNVLAFCFMPNHIHLLLKQSSEGGITRFMRKLGVGYAGYFNRKYQRKGHVFQNRFKDVHIKNDNQLMAVVNYIHTNPVSLIEPSWKTSGVKNLSLEEVIKFLENYKWSSYQDYLGRQNFPSVTERDFMVETMKTAGGCKNAVDDWVKCKKDFMPHEELLLE
jgi:putative transposase